MKGIQKKIREDIVFAENIRIPHIIYLDDFNTNYPNTNRISRIACEINEYLKRKNRDEMGTKR